MGSEPFATALCGHALARSIALMAVMAVLLTACAAPRNPVPYARMYPAAPDRAQTLDIQVVRGTHHIEFTNTTARAFGPSTIWLNGRFSRPIDGVDVGETVRVRLTDFRDENFEAFRAGGFFAAGTPDPLVLAELETEDAGSGQKVFYGLIVVGGLEISR